MTDTFDTTETTENTEVVEASQYNLDAEFEKAYGVPLTQAQAEYNMTLVVNQLGDIWDASPKATKARLDEVMAYVQKLPEDRRAEYDSVEGVNKAWTEMNAKQQTAPTVKASGGIFNNIQPKQAATPRKPSDFTREQIKNDISAYQAAIFDEMKREGLL
jgi:hypothetical protein